MGIFSSMFRGIGSLFGAWNHGHADEAYKLLVAAGSGNARAKGTLDAIKRAAAGGDPRAIEAQRKIVAVAKMVTAGMPMPSVLAARKAAGQPLRLVSDTAALKATILRQQQALRQQRVRQAQAVQRLLAQQKQQSAKALAQRGQAEARINVRRAEQDEYEGKLADLRNQLMMRDIADDKRLRFVFKTMRAYGDHLQFSVFECQLTAADLARRRQARPPPPSKRRPPRLRRRPRRRGRL